MGSYGGDSDTRSFIMAYEKDAWVSIAGSVERIEVDDFIRVLCAVNNSGTMLLAVGEKAVTDYEEYNEFRDKESLDELKEFFRRNRRDGVGFMKIRISKDDRLIMALYNAFKGTGRFVEFNGVVR